MPTDKTKYLVMLLLPGFFAARAQTTKREKRALLKSTYLGMTINERGSVRYLSALYNHFVICLQI